jgi:regulator of cell morphogenesis and NO signaling
MKPISQATVNDVIRQFPPSIAVFNAFRIDACCGGAASVEEAGKRDGADVEKLVEALEAIAGEAK